MHRRETPAENARESSGPGPIRQTQKTDNPGNGLVQRHQKHRFSGGRLTAGLMMLSALAVGIVFALFRSDPNPPAPDAATELRSVRIPTDRVLPLPSEPKRIPDEVSRLLDQDSYPAISPGSGDRITWSKFRLRNSSHQPRSVVIGSWDFPMRSGTLYQITATGVQPVSRADLHSTGNRPFHNYRLPVLQTTVPPGGATYLAAAEFVSFTSRDLHIWSGKEFVRYHRIESLLYGFLFGVLLLLSGYHLFLSLSVHNATYTYYLVYLVSMGWFMIQISGYPGTLWPVFRNRWVHQLCLVSFPSVIWIACTMFHLYLLEIGRHFPRLYRFTLYAFIPCGLLMLITPWLPDQTGLLLQELNTGVFSLINCGLVTFATIRRLPYYKPFLVSWANYCTGIAIYGLAVSAVIEAGIITSYILPLFQVSSMVILSMVNGERMKVTERNLMESRLMAAAARSAQDTFKTQEKIPGIDINRFSEGPAEAGGDLYGYRYLRSGGQLVFYIGNVAGTGIDASVISCALSAAIHTRFSGRTARGKPDGEELLLYLVSGAQQLVRRTAGGDGRTASLAIGLLDLHSGRGWLLNAGHTPVYLKEPSRELCAIGNQGPLLGAGVTGDLMVRSFRFTPGSTLFLHTDGILADGRHQAGALTRADLESLLMADAEDLPRLTRTLQGRIRPAHGTGRRGSFCLLTLTRARDQAGESVA